MLLTSHTIKSMLSRSLFALTAVAVLAACSDDPVAPVNSGRLRAVNAVSNLTALDVLINTTSYKAGLAYKGTDGYKAASIGTQTVRFRKVGSTADLHNAATPVAVGNDYTVIALGTEAAPQSFVLTDNNSAPAAGKVKLRLVHAAAGTNALDAYVLANANELATATPARANLAVKGASDYLVRDAGTFVIIFTEAGTKTPVLTIGNVQVTGGRIRTILAVNKTGGGTPLEGVLLADS